MVEYPGTDGRRGVRSLWCDSRCCQKVSGMGGRMGGAVGICRRLFRYVRGCGKGWCGWEMSKAPVCKRARDGRGALWVEVGCLESIRMCGSRCGVVGAGLLCSDERGG